MGQLPWLPIRLESSSMIRIHIQLVKKPPKQLYFNTLHSTKRHLHQAKDTHRVPVYHHGLLVFLYGPCVYYN